MHNKSLQADNLRGICIVVSLSLHFTTMQTPHKLRLSEALDEINPERRVYIDSVRPITLALYVLRITEI